MKTKLFIILVVSLIGLVCLPLAPSKTLAFDSPINTIEIVPYRSDAHTVDVVEPYQLPSVPTPQSAATFSAPIFRSLRLRYEAR